MRGIKLDLSMIYSEKKIQSDVWKNIAIPKTSATYSKIWIFWSILYF